MDLLILRDFADPASCEAENSQPTHVGHLVLLDDACLHWDYTFSWVVFRNEQRGVCRYHYADPACSILLSNCTKVETRSDYSVSDFYSPEQTSEFIPTGTCVGSFRMDVLSEYCAVGEPTADFTLPLYHERFFLDRSDCASDPNGGTVSEGYLPIDVCTPWRDGGSNRVSLQESQLIRHEYQDEECSIPSTNNNMTFTVGQCRTQRGASGTYVAADSPQYACRDVSRLVHPVDIELTTSAATAVVGSGWIEALFVVTSISWWWWR